MVIWIIKSHKDFEIIKEEDGKNMVIEVEEGFEPFSCSTVNQVITFWFRKKLEV